MKAGLGGEGRQSVQKKAEKFGECLPRGKRKGVVGEDLCGRHSEFSTRSKKKATKGKGESSSSPEDYGKPETTSLKQRKAK